MILVTYYITNMWIKQHLISHVCRDLLCLQQYGRRIRSWCCYMLWYRFRNKDANVAQALASVPDQPYAKISLPSIMITWDICSFLLFSTPRGVLIHEFLSVWTHLGSRSQEMMLLICTMVAASGWPTPSADHRKWCTWFARWWQRVAGLVQLSRQALI